jgi:hypothetical protein
LTRASVSVRSRIEFRKHPYDREETEEEDVARVPETGHHFPLS